MFFVIAVSEDGEVSARSYTKSQLEQALADGELDPKTRRSLNEKGKCEDLMCGGGWLLIEGEQRVPKPKQTVTTWSVE